MLVPGHLAALWWPIDLLTRWTGPRGEEVEGRAQARPRVAGPQSRLGRVPCPVPGSTAPARPRYVRIRGGGASTSWRRAVEARASLTRRLTHYRLLHPKQMLSSDFKGHHIPPDHLACHLTFWNNRLFSCFVSHSDVFFTRM